MSDRELLVLAAKAAGISEIEQYAESGWLRRDTGETWNPLIDDGDALRLAVKLGLHVFALLPNEGNPSSCSNGETMEPHGDDPYAATRRAIVRAAAELGRAM